MTASILHGVSDIFDSWLGLAGNSKYGSKVDVPKYKSKTAAKALSENVGPLPVGDRLVTSPQDVICQAMRCLTENVAKAQEDKRKVADSNWEWKKSLDLSEKNNSPEKVLEKVIAFLFGNEWVNQVPTCNGLVPEGSSACRIDLAHRIASQHFELIELKFGLTEEKSGSNYPLFAAMEILEYGLLYIAFRQLNLLGNSLGKKHELLHAKTIELVVLAPRDWYRVDHNAEKFYNFSWLEQSINDGLKAYMNQQGMKDFTMLFRFETLPQEFTTAFNSLMKEINTCRDNALKSRKALYANG